jgi:hypothetical protein
MVSQLHALNTHISLVFRTYRQAETFAYVYGRRSISEIWQNYMSNYESAEAALQNG